MRSHLISIIIALAASGVYKQKKARTTATATTIGGCGHVHTIKLVKTENARFYALWRRRPHSNARLVGVLNSDDDDNDDGGDDNNDDDEREINRGDKNQIFFAAWMFTYKDDGFALRNAFIDCRPPIAARSALSTRSKCNCLFASFLRCS